MTVSEWPEQHPQFLWCVLKLSDVKARKAFACGEKWEYNDERQTSNFSKNLHNQIFQQNILHSKNAKIASIFANDKTRGI